MKTRTPRDLRGRQRSSFVSAIISISLVLFMLGLLGLLLIDAGKLSNYVKEHVQLNVFLNDDAVPAEVSAFQNLLENSAFTRSVHYTSKEEALDSLKKDLGEGAVSMLESNPLPASIDLRLKAEYTHPDSVKAIQAMLSGNKLVKEISYQRTEVSRMNENFRTVALILLGFCGLLFFVAVALINNTIRLALYSGRFLIKSMQLVGATKAFIRKPFLRSGVVQGIYGGAISCLLLGAVIYTIHVRFPDLGQLSDLRLIGVLLGTVFLFGVFLSGLSTLFAVNRYLRLRVGDLY